MSAILKINTKTIFFPVFAALSVFVVLWFSNYNHELFHFTDRVLGISTLNKIDVKLRISQFYKAFFCSFFTFTGTLLLSNYFFNTKRRIRVELLLINYVSLIAVFSILLYVFNQNTKFSILFLSSLISALILTSTIKLIFKNWFVYSENFFFLWTGMISLSITVLLFYITGKTSSSGFLILFSLLIVFISLIFSIEALEINFKLLYKTFIFWITIPFFIFFSQELFLIFNQRGIQILKPEIILLIIGILISGITIYLFVKNRKQNSFSNIKHIKRLYITIFILSISFFAYYTAFGKEPGEMFEAANMSNSIMNLFHFGRFPVFEFLPTHLVRDLSYGYIYSFLNGYQADFSYTAYRFLLTIVTILIFYFFVKKLTGKYIALLILLFFPFISVVTWGIKGALFLLVPLIINRLYADISLKNFILFFLVLLLEVSWSPDSGSASLIILSISLIVIISLKYKKKLLKNLFNAFCIVFIPVIIIVTAIILIKDIDFIDNIKTALEFYSSSPQARGLSEISKEYNSLFIFHHIVSPFLVLSISAVLILKSKTFFKKNPFLFISVITIAFFYLLNFQRGLTRHSFYEGNDTILSSLLFLLIALYTFWFNIKSKILKSSFFVAVLVFLVLGFKLKPINKKFDLISELQNKIEKPVEQLYADSPVKRVKTNDLYSKNKDFITFIEENTQKGETYFDFSNHPVLYFLTQSNTPVYFLHFLAVTNDNLQEKMIKELSEQNIPFAIFSSYPETWWDKTDQVKNSVRYYKIAEYIYQNYTPYTIINKHVIWKKKGHIINANYDLTIPDNSNVYALKKLPYVWANYDSAVSKAEIIQQLKTSDSINNSKFRFSKDFDKSSGNFLKLDIQNNNKTTCKCTVEIMADSVLIGSFNFDIINNKPLEKYIIRPSVEYNWYRKPANTLKVSFSKPGFKVKNISLLKGN